MWSVCMPHRLDIHQKRERGILGKLEPSSHYNRDLIPGPIRRFVSSLPLFAPGQILIAHPVSFIAATLLFFPVFLCAIASALPTTGIRSKLQHYTNLLSIQIHGKALRFMYSNMFPSHFGPDTWLSKTVLCRQSLTSTHFSQTAFTNGMFSKFQQVVSGQCIC